MLHAQRAGAPPLVLHVDWASACAQAGREAPVQGYCQAEYCGRQPGGWLGAGGLAGGWGGGWGLGGWGGGWGRRCRQQWTATQAPDSAAPTVWPTCHIICQAPCSHAAGPMPPQHCRATHAIHTSRTTQAAPQTPHHTRRTTHAFLLPFSASSCVLCLTCTCCPAHQLHQLHQLRQPPQQHAARGPAPCGASTTAGWATGSQGMMVSRALHTLCCW